MLIINYLNKAAGTTVVSHLPFKDIGADRQISHFNAHDLINQTLPFIRSSGFADASNHAVVGRDDQRAVTVGCKQSAEFSP